MGHFCDRRVYDIGLTAIRDESPLFCAGRRTFRDMTTSVRAISGHIQFGT